MIAIGLVFLVLAGIVGLVTGLANSGSDHTVTNFSILGFDAAGSSGRIFIEGAIAGLVAMLGLNMMLAGLGRGFKNKVRHHRERKAMDRQNESEGQVEVHPPS